MKSGFPEVTFVAPSDFIFLKLALEQPGRGVVIEGPSGVGKTTAVEKAVEELKNAGSKAHIPIKNILSARNPEHRHLLQTLREWHDGTVIIDDFHRLDLAFRQELVDYLKELADTTAKTKKLAIVGIPHTRQSLVERYLLAIVIKMLNGWNDYVCISSQLSAMASLICGMIQRLRLACNGKGPFKMHLKLPEQLFY